MFWHQESVGPVDVVFTDASTDLSEASGRVAVAEELDVAGLTAMRQVHGRSVVDTDGSGLIAECDGLVTATPEVALLVRVADCVPVLLADPDAGVVGAAHAGRVGMTLDVVTATVERMRQLGAESIQAWVGPRACARCYELPEAMADEVEATEPGTRSTTSWGTPSIDVGRGVVQQLERAGVEVHDLGADACTIEDESLWSYRRQGDAAGRFGGVVVLR